MKHLPRKAGEGLVTIPASVRWRETFVVPPGDKKETDRGTEAPHVGRLAVDRQARPIVAGIEAEPDRKPTADDNRRVQVGLSAGATLRRDQAQSFSQEQPLAEVLSDKEARSEDRRLAGEFSARFELPFAGVGTEGQGDRSHALATAGSPAIGAGEVVAVSLQLVEAFGVALKNILAIPLEAELQVVPVLRLFVPLVGRCRGAIVAKAHSCLVSVYGVSERGEHHGHEGREPEFEGHGRLLPLG